MRNIFGLLLLAFLITLSFVICPTYYSQVKQDKFANEHYFHNMRHGIFVDIGAFDGVRYSNTYFFEKYLGWRGLCIEPIPEIYEQLVKNRKAICVNGCVSAQAGKAAFLKINNNEQKDDGPIWLSGLIENYDQRHVDRIEKEIEANGASKELIEVDCYVLNELLEKYALYHIDYLSLDTEGSELKILKSINYKRFKIFMIDVENNYNTPEIRQFLATKGFELVKEMAGDEFYINKRNRRKTS